MHALHPTSISHLEENWETAPLSRCESGDQAIRRTPLEMRLRL